MVGQTISPYGIVDGLGGGGMGVVYEAEDHPPCLLLFLLGEVVGDSQAWLLFSEKPKLLLLSIIPISAKSFARAQNGDCTGCGSQSLPSYAKYVF
jgi:hypothetical protein